MNRVAAVTGRDGTEDADGSIDMTTESATRTLPTSQDLTEHLPRVHRIVAHFMRRLPRSVQREDLVAAGTLGLFHALRASEHTCPEMFAAYARIRIRGSIVDELRRHDWSPRRRKETTEGPGARQRHVERGEHSAGSSPRRRHRLRRSARRLHGWPRAGRRLALDDVLERSAHAALHTAVEQLPKRQREIIRMRYFQGKRSKAIAQAMGLSEARTSQLHARATNQLRDLLQLAEAPSGSPGKLKLAA